MSTSTIADLAAALRLRRAGREWRGDCPACQYPGTFSLTIKGGCTVWHCASCQDRAALTAAVRSAMGAAYAPPERAEAPKLPRDDTRTARALADWHSAIPIAGTLAELYLRHRALSDEPSATLRFHGGLRHPSVTGIFPAMVALVTSTVTGKPVAIHRTFLARDGSGKAALDPAKASKGPIRSGAIMLHRPIPGVPLVIGEGIETALSAGRIIGAPAWSCIAAGNLAAIAPPQEASELIIAADADDPGSRAAEDAARRWKAMGRQVRIAVPRSAGQDFNDLMRARQAQGASHG